MANINIPVYHTKGNLSFATNLPEIAQMVEDWADTKDRHYAPKSLEDVEDDASFADVVKMCHIEAEDLWTAKTAFPAAFAAEDELEAEVQGSVIDEYDGESPELTRGAREAVLSEQEMLEQIPLPGTPEGERERLKIWISLPQKKRG